MHSTFTELSSQDPLCIGIIGGGQLGKMIAQEAKRMSFKIVILDPNESCPASSVCDKLIVGDFKEEDKIYDLAENSDILTYEIELADSYALANLESKSYPIYPSPHLLRIVQNKFGQKTFLKEQNLPIPEFELINSKDDFSLVSEKYGFPFMLKASEESYDGRGNYLIKNPDQFKDGYSHFENIEFFAEKFIDFKKEISIMVARNLAGQIESFPVAENIHTNNILDTTIVPAQVSYDVLVRSETIAKNVVLSLNGVGIFGIELFLTKDDNLLINEIAPRPHNSGHYSIEGCSVNQFEQHIRSILNMPLYKPELLRPTIMKNILGPENLSGSYKINGLQNLFSIPSTKIHIYGKRTTSPGRKLGHITSTGKSLDETLIRANKAKNSIEIITDKI